MVNISELEPRNKEKVIDLVGNAGIDVSDWSNFSGKYASQNPKYCYEWAFLQPGVVAVFNLWHRDLTQANGLIVRRGNYREDANFYRDSGTGTNWERRARKADQVMQEALKQHIPVRAIINEGIQRVQGDTKATASQVKRRQLDTDVWTITKYDLATGAHVLTRGPGYIDQFSLGDAIDEHPERRERTSSHYVRNPAVRTAALARASGRCEHCKTAGFIMANGSIYLETHHIVPLAENGLDSLHNVIALCPNHHREAHHGEARDMLRAHFQAIVSLSPAI